MPFLAALLMFLIPILSVQPDTVPVQGTIVMFVPYKDGAILASDSRQTLPNGLKCDNDEKIFPVKNHDHALLAIINAELIMNKADLVYGCDRSKYTHPLLDFRKVASDYLGQYSGPVTDEQYAGLKSYLKKEWLDPILPYSQGLITERKYIFTLVLVELVDHQTKFRAFAFMTADKKTVYEGPKMAEDQIIKLADIASTKSRLAGMTPCSDFASSPIGRALLPPKSFAVWDWATINKITVAGMDKQHASKFAVEGVRNTGAIWRLKPALNCRVGGPTHVFSVEDDGWKEEELGLVKPKNPATKPMRRRSRDRRDIF